MTIAKKDTALATAPATKPAKTVVSNLVLGNADDALRLATELQKFVKANKLTSNIQGKEFPNVEAWQFAGGLLGLSSMLESIDDRSTADEIKWHATVQVIHLATSNVVGRGFATCSNKESTKKFFADYAIASMAQTRAVGKAYRLALGWLMKAAGYEATPAEEMQEQEAGTGATVVVEQAAAEPARVQVPGTVSTQAEIDEREIAGHRTRLLYAKKLADVIQIWKEIPTHLKPELVVDKEKAKNRFAQPPAASKERAHDKQLMEEFVEQPTLGMNDGPLTEAQAKEIQTLINLRPITAKEKALLLPVLYKLDELRASQLIFKLLNEIALREGQDADKEFRVALHRFTVNYADQLGDAAAERLRVAADDKSLHWQQVRAKLLAAKEWLSAQAVAA